MNLKFYTALFYGKAIAFLLSLIGRGGTAAPGLYALNIRENLIKELIERNKLKSIVISGTNGKTTTARITSHLLGDKFEIIHNRQGSNLLRGIASTLLKKSTLSGKIKENLAVWEADEAILPEAIRAIKPQILVLLNLFRDQLDRYGEIETIKEKWQKAVSNLPKEAVIIANADDPSIVSILSGAKQNILFFGMGDEQIALPQISNISDVKLCPVCQNRLSYKANFTSHLGDYYCSKCKFQRPKLNLIAKNLKFNDDFSSDSELISPNFKTVITLKLPGLFNIYNLLAAFQAASELKISGNELKNSIQNFSGAFGRFQRVEINEKKILIFLIKNPTGANEVIRTISSGKNLRLLAILNDNIADGKDVSWIWDTSWESLSKQDNKAAVSGTRAWDLALRFKYAGLNMGNDNVHEDINYSIRRAIKALDKNSTLYILPTYTAMLETQKVLSEMGAAKKWHKD